MPIDIDYHPCQGRVENTNTYLTFTPLPPLNHWVQVFWQLNVPDGQYYYRSVPDNCVDLIINLTFPEETFIVTPFASSIVFEMTGPVSYFGIRFRILGHQGITSAPLGAWNKPDNFVNTNEILPEHILNAAYDDGFKQLQFHNRCKYFSKILLGSLQHSKIDSRLARYIRYCHQNITSCIDLSDKQCSEFGVSARQLRRLTRLYLGLSPREFAKVLRFQQTLQVMNTENCSSAWARHYYDQPHFIRDFKSMSGITPNEFQGSSVLYNTG